jgi:hypothetical protein
LQWEKGRTQSLVERGYIKPGDRILLFPTTPEERLRAELPRNDLAPRRTLARSAARRLKYDLGLAARRRHFEQLVAIVAKCSYSPRRLRTRTRRQIVG